jgi:two-component system cell cycle sensor histidine kinase/response regulator CckA
MDAEGVGVAAPHGAQHNVLFYESESELHASVTDFILEGLTQGESVILAATPAHQEALLDALERRGFNLELAHSQGRLLLIDADAGVQSITRRGRPQRVLFEAWLIPRLSAAKQASANGRVRAYGEFVSLLARSGNHEAAVELESMWNELLALDDRIELLCGYRLADFPRGEDHQAFRNVCREHHRVRSATNRSVLAHPERLAARVAELEQLAHSLQAEVAERKRVELELRKAQQNLVRASKLEAMGRLSAGIAHDFNNLLTAVDFTAELLLADNLPQPQRVRAAEEIKSTAKKAGALIRQLLAFDGSRPHLASLLEINQAVLGMRSLLVRLLDARIDLRFDLDEQAGCLLVDPTQFEQMLLNLAINAAEAMPAGGRLDIRTRTHPLAAQRGAFGSLPAGNYVLLEVEDTGSGMSADTLSNVFEPFFSTKEHRPGAGLGLTTVHGIVTQSGGQINVDSELGRGSRFQVLLPQLALPDTAPDTGLTEALSTSSNRPLDILLAEDEGAVRMHLCETLRDWGHRVVAAADGTSALRHADELEHLDLFITDIVMPGRTGPDVASSLLARHPQLAVLYMSGYAPEGLRTSKRDVGHASEEPKRDPARTSEEQGSERCGFLQKPFTRSQFARAVVRLMQTVPQREPTD